MVVPSTVICYHKTMFNKIKKRLDGELRVFLRRMERAYKLSAISPLLESHIREFVLRDGKRIRPILFIAGYTGYAKRTAKGLYTSALALELLHDFMLVHDDIVDRSDTRRGKPSMHKMLDAYLARFQRVKCEGRDLAIVAGDVMYALAINAFLAIQEGMDRKERALKKFIEAAMYTGGGEFAELILGMKDFSQIRLEDIYRIYDFKTAHYSFASPLASGAILAGAAEEEVRRISEYGICLGRAFQIKDDIIGMFGDEKKIGKPLLTDLQERKKTVLVYYAYRNALGPDRLAIRRIFSKEKVERKDLLTMRALIRRSRALDFAKREILAFSARANRLLASLRMRPVQKRSLSSYVAGVLGT